MDKLRIGILGGISYESTIKYYELLMSKYYETHLNYHYPEVVIFSLNFQKFTDLEDAHDKTGYINYILDGIKSLEASRVDIIVMAANSPHAVFNELQENTHVPIINIVEIVAEKAYNEGLNTLLLLGIKFTMQSSFYQKIFKEKGMELLTPSLKEQNKINEIIFKELVLGVIYDKSKNYLIQLIEKYNVDGVILGCTELPMLINQQDINIPVLNSLELHIDALLKKTQ